MEHKEKFTQGPWLIRKFTGEGWPEKRISIAEQGGGSLFINARYAENSEANAHLIACAPEMYEMLDALLKYNIPRTSLEAMQIRKLLAKARGEGEA